MLMVNTTAPAEEVAPTEEATVAAPVESQEVASDVAPEVAIPKTKAELKDDQRRADIDMGIDALVGDIIEQTMAFSALINNFREGAIEGKSKAKKHISDLRDGLFSTAYRLKTAAGLVTAFGEEVLPAVASQSPAAQQTPESIQAKIDALQAQLAKLNSQGATQADAAIAATETAPAV